MKKRNIICLLLAVLTLLSCAACVLYPEQFADIDPETKASEIFTELLGSDPYPDLKEAGYAFRAITLGE